MNKSDQIRQLASEGWPTADIARKLGIRYQFARNVLVRAGTLTARKRDAKSVEIIEKLPLTAKELAEGGFVHVATWRKEDGRLAIERALAKQASVYAFVIDGVAQYVGVATMSLAKRLYFYAKPGATQRTSIRVAALILNHIVAGIDVEIFTAHPPTGEWNGLPINMSAGLELGLIQKFYLPWNLRSAK